MAWELPASPKVTNWPVKVLDPLWDEIMPRRVRSTNALCGIAGCSGVWARLAAGESSRTASRITGTTRIDPPFLAIQRAGRCAPRFVVTNLAAVDVDARTVNVPKP